MRPFQSAFNVNLAKDPLMDAWKGAREFGRTAPASSYVSRAQYEVYIISGLVISCHYKKLT